MKAIDSYEIVEVYKYKIEQLRKYGNWEDMRNSLSEEQENIINSIMQAGKDSDISVALWYQLDFVISRLNENIVKKSMSCAN